MKNNLYYKRKIYYRIWDYFFLIIVTIGYIDWE